MTQVTIVQASRVPSGSFQGQLKSLSATQLGAHVIKDLSQYGQTQSVKAVYMGCVLPAGLGQAPTRQAVRFAGLEDSVSAVTINKVCGSGLQSVIEASKGIELGHYDCAIAGGMESMTNAPYIAERVRAGLRMGHAHLLDHMLYDGLEDAYHKKAMGVFADETALKYGISREEQDNFAIQSWQKAMDAQQKAYFINEIIPIDSNDKEKILLTTDEPPRKGNPDKVPKLKPAFSPNGTVTAANASSVADGAAGVLLMSHDLVHKGDAKPLARIVGYASHSHSPELFTTAPITAVDKLCKQIGWTIKEVDLFEINEAFAVVSIVTAKELGIPFEKVNIHGGACALGHPIGASGARILVTLTHALHHHHLKKGIAVLCIGGGEAVAMAIERL